MNELSAVDIKNIFSLLDKVMKENKDYLIELDAKVGDGDLGITMEKGFSSANVVLQDCADENIGLLFMKAGMSIANSAPSTMGTLVGSGFMKAGKVLLGKNQIAVDDLSIAMMQFVESIMQKGRAKPGDKTIIDSMHPAAMALEKAEKENEGLKDALELAYNAALQGLENTKSMLPMHGKQVAHRNKSVGLIDPGALVGTLIIKTFAEHFKM